MISTTQTVQPYAFTPGSPPATFAIPFAYQQTAEIKATLSQSGLADVVLTQGVDYSVSAAPASSGTLTRIGTWAAWAAYGNIVIYRQTSLVNALSIVNGGVLDADALELELDELTQMIQESAAATSIAGKPLLFPLTDPAGLVNTLPSVATRALKQPSFDASGNLVVTSPSAAAINAAWQAALAQPLTTGIQAAFLPETVISSDTTLMAGGLYRARGRLILTLPASASEGQHIEIYTEDYCILAQSDAQHGISFKGKYYTTPGVSVLPPSATQAGYVRLPPKTRMVISFHGTGQSPTLTPTLLTAPTAPGGTPTICAYSPDGKYVAVLIGSTSPFLNVYKKDASGDTWTKLSDPPAAVATLLYCGWSPDSTYLAVVTATTPFLQVYKRSGDTFTILTTGQVPAATGAANFVAVSPDGQYIAVSENTTQIEVYKRTAGTDNFPKLSNPPVAAGNVSCLSWSPDGNALAVGSGITPFVQVYRRCVDTFVFISAIPAAAATPTNVLFSPDGMQLVALTSSLQIYKRGGQDSESYVLLSGFPAASAGFKTNTGAWSPNGRYFAAGESFLDPEVWVRRFDSFTKLATLPASGDVPFGTSFSPDGRYLFFSGNVTIKAGAWKMVTDITKAWEIETMEWPYYVEPENLFV